jgi:hypothetical protein
MHALVMQVLRPSHVDFEAEIFTDSVPISPVAEEILSPTPPAVSACKLSPKTLAPFSVLFAICAEFQSQDKSISHRSELSEAVW